MTLAIVTPWGSLSLIWVLGGLAFCLAVFGLYLVSLARRPRVPCTTCKQGDLVITRDFAHRCTACGARFRREHGVLVPDAGSAKRDPR